MVEPRDPTHEPAGRILWGRVGVAAAVVLIAFSFGRCGSDDEAEAEVAQLEQEVASLRAENDTLQGRVDSLNGLLEQSTSQPEPSEAAQTGNPDPGTASPGGNYTVQSGDTLGSIALQVYGDSQRAGAIAAANGLSTGDTLQVGQVLRLPADE